MKIVYWVLGLFLAFVLLLGTAASFGVAASTPFFGPMMYSSYMPYAWGGWGYHFIPGLGYQYAYYHGGYGWGGSLYPGYAYNGSYVYRVGYPSRPVYVTNVYVNQVHPAAGAPPVRNSSGTVVTPAKAPTAAPSKPTTATPKAPAAATASHACSGSAGCTGNGNAATQKSNGGGGGCSGQAGCAGSGNAATQKSSSSTTTTKPAPPSKPAPSGKH